MVYNYLQTTPEVGITQLHNLGHTSAYVPKRDSLPSSLLFWIKVKVADTKAKWAEKTAKA